MISRSTASRMNPRTSSASAQAARTRSSVPAAKLTRNFSGNSSFRPTRRGLSHIRISGKADIFRISYIDDLRTITHIRYQSNGANVMSSLAYFADLPTGETIEFKAHRVPTFVDRMGIQRTRVVEPKVQRCIPTDGSADALTGNVLCGYVEGRGWTRITRTVTMKANPSRHECDARCMNASGRVMNCECSCGGANHGKGRFMCEAA